MGSGGSQTPAWAAHEVMTVTGPVRAADLGITLPHEHLLIDLTGYVQHPVEASRVSLLDAPVTLDRLDEIRRNPYYNRDTCLLGDIPTAIAEAQLFRNLGGRTIVDLTIPDIGRDPRALAQVSHATGLNVIAGCGHYVHAAQPPQLADEPLESIAERLIREVADGIDASAIRAGIIGEIGTTDPLHPQEEKVLRAAGRAQRETGVAISIHVHPPTRYAHHVLDVLEEEGVDPRVVVLGHLDGVLGQWDITFEDAVAHHVSLAERGAYIEYDLCGNDGTTFQANGRSWGFPSDQVRAKALRMLVDAGFGDQLLVSQDVGHKHYLVRYGGWGYGHILRSFVAMLEQAGIGSRDVRRILVDNPARMLVGSAAIGSIDMAASER